MDDDDVREWHFGNANGKERKKLINSLFQEVDKLTIYGEY